MISFYYDWRTTKFNLGTHAFYSSRVALRNAEKLTPLNKKEKDIILKHMFTGATLAGTTLSESLIVSLVDDFRKREHETGSLDRYVQKCVGRLRNVGCEQLLVEGEELNYGTISSRKSALDEDCKLCPKFYTYIYDLGKEMELGLKSLRCCLKMATCGLQRYCQ